MKGPQPIVPYIPIHPIQCDPPLVTVLEKRWQKPGTGSYTALQSNDHDNHDDDDLSRLPKLLLLEDNGESLFEDGDVFESNIWGVVIVEIESETELEEDTTKDGCC